MGARKSCVGCSALSITATGVVEPCKLGFKFEIKETYVAFGQAQQYTSGTLEEPYPTENCPRPKSFREFLKMKAALGGS